MDYEIYLPGGFKVSDFYSSGKLQKKNNNKGLQNRIRNYISKLPIHNWITKEFSDQW
jgi:hypothetical protein